MTETKKYDNVYWRKLRREKEIPLVGALSEYVQASYSHIAQWEKKPNHPMAEEKIERYIAFITAFPDAPPEIADDK
jgi:hypothetical protein